MFQILPDFHKNYLFWDGSLLDPFYENLDIAKLLDSLYHNLTAMLSLRGMITRQQKGDKGERP